MMLAEIQKTAEKLGIQPKGMEKTDLIRSIQRAKGDLDCFGTVDHCYQTNCLFRNDCLVVDSHNHVSVKDLIKEMNLTPAVKSGKNDPDDSAFELKVTKDKIKAFICPIKENFSEVGLDSIKLFLAREGIRNGIIQDTLIIEYLASKPSKDKQLKIAEGKAPDPGKPPVIKYYFDINPLKAASIDEKGNIDHKNKGEIPQVVPEDLLAEIIPGEKGKPGKDIYGEEAPPQKHPALKILCGKGVRLIKEDTTAIAEISGRPILKNNGRICVSDTFSISGDLGVKTGNIVFNGHIEVQGAVQEGYKVKGKTLKAKEIHNAEVEIEGDIVVSRGIIGSKILTDGSVKAKHIRDTTIDALGNVTVEKEVYESHIETNGIFKMEGGTFLNSTISAMRGVEASDIGSEVSDPNTILIGIDNRLEKKITLLNLQIADKEKERKKLTEAFETTENLCENLDKEIGEKAQQQDVAMVKGRTLKRTFESFKEKNDLKNVIKIVKIIKTFNSRIEETENELNELIKEQNAAKKDAENKNKRLEELDAEILALHDDIKNLIVLAAIRKSTTGVKVKGTIYDNTSIKGRNASFVTKGNLQRVHIEEIKAKDAGPNKNWSMSISSF